MMNSIIIILSFYLYIINIIHVNGLCPNSCSFQGRCGAYNKCTCYSPFFGHDCSQRYCPKGKAWGNVTATDIAHEYVECSGRGICDRSNGVCSCQSGFEGNACQSISCPNNCNENGICMTMQSYASNEVEALDNHDGSPYTYNTIWDYDMIRGCKCDYGYYGVDCSLRSCSLGDDPLTTGQIDETQVIQCTTEYSTQVISLHFDSTINAGTFSLFYGTAYTRPLSYDISANDMKTQLESTIGNSATLTVSKTDQATYTSWTVSITHTTYHPLRPGWVSSEVQEFLCMADSGNLKIHYNGQSTGNIAAGATNTEIAAALELLNYIDDVTVSVSDSTACTMAGSVVSITFVSMLDRENIGDIPELTVTDVDLTSTGTKYLETTAKEIVKGINTCRVNEVQSIYCKADGGTFSITFDGTTLSNINFSASASDIETALETITSVVDVDVSFDSGASACSSSGVVTSITFVLVTTTGVGSDGDLSAISVDTSSLTSSETVDVTISEVIKGSVCTSIDAPYKSNPNNQISTYINSGGGFFTATFRGETSRPIPAEASKESVIKYLKELSTINDIEISFTQTEACSTPKNTMVLTFTQNFGNLPTVSVDGTGLVSGSTIEVTSGGDIVDGITTYDGTKESLPCSGRGTCDGTKTTGCECYSGYVSSGTSKFSRGDCGVASGAIADCPGEIQCSGHGSCSGSPAFKCSCEYGWMGGDCSSRTCEFGLSWFSYPSADEEAHKDMKECSNAGICDRTTGKCTCVDPFTGGACEKIKCPSSSNEVCSGHGQCLNLRNLANFVTDNGDATSLTYGSNTNNMNTWGSLKIQSCFCDSGYTGFDCSLQECPRGDDVNTDNDYSEVQLLKCTATSGTFKLKFRQESTDSIPYNADQSYLEGALEALSTIGEVSISFTGSSACSDTGVLITITFNTELGKLPPLQADSSSLSGGSINIATHGSAIDGTNSVTGTKENDYCSNHGKCDFTSGLCTCDDQWMSSNGQGGLGHNNDCGYHHITLGGISSI